MFNAAVEVSVGMVGLKPAEGALLKSVVQGVELGPLELTHAARILASVSISACGTVPLPAGVVASAWPVSGFSRFAIASVALSRAFAASAVLELDECKGSEEKPA